MAAEERWTTGVTGIRVRFNDLMQTVLAAQKDGAPGSGTGTVTLWRQCVDLLAQNDRPGRAPLHPRDRAALLDRLEQLRTQVSETQRIATVVELGGRMGSPSLIRFFANDRPAICAAAMARARLPDTVWVGLLPDLGPVARGVLRARRDMGPETARGLQSFGSTDFVLTSDVAAAPDFMLTPDMAEALPSLPSPQATPAPAVVDPVDAAVTPLPVADEAASQIRRLVDRIEQYTSGHRPRPTVAPPAEPAMPVTTRAFAFETDGQGVLVWVGEGPRAALIGLSIAEPALPGGSGPDAHVSGAFGRRSGFQNGRFHIDGGTLTGEWRMSAVPFFDPQTGRFQGFRGNARRPHLHEVPSGDAGLEGLPLGGLSADSIRQLVHELRTPLNAILGFAEIIEQQLFGPAAAPYRDMAGQIMGDARHLLAAFDDLDLAARVARAEEAAEPRPVDAALLVARVATRFRMDRGEQAQPIDISVAPGLPFVRVDPVQGERMVQHLLRTVVSVAQTDETVTGACWFQPDDGIGAEHGARCGPANGSVILAMDRPCSLDGLEETQLLDPGYSPDGDWPEASLLGLGFSLRLIRSLAAGSGGTLEIDEERFLLTMPVAHEDPDAG